MIYVMKSLQFLIDVIFYYIIFYSYRNKNIPKIVFWERCLLFSLVNVGLLSFFCYYSGNSPFVRILFIILSIIYLCFEERSLKNLRFIITYSCTVAFITEGTYFLISISVVNLSSFFGIIDRTDRDIFWFISLVLYLIVVLLIYKYKFIQIDIIKKLSRYGFMPAFLMVFIISFMAAKYFYKQIGYTELSLTISGIITTTVLILLFVYSIISRRIEGKNIAENEQLKREIDDETELLLGQLGITKKEYNRQNRIFENKLSKINIDMGSKGFGPIALCLVLIKNFKGIHINLTQDVYPIASKIVKSSVGNITKNMSYAISKSIDTIGPEEFEEECGLHVDPKKGMPTLKEFLINLAKHTDIS